MCGLLTSAGDTGWRARWGCRRFLSTCISVAEREGDVERVRVVVGLDFLRVDGRMD